MSGPGSPVDLLVIDAVATRHGTYRSLLGELVRQVVTEMPGEGARQRFRTGDFAAVLVNLDGASGGAAADLAAIASPGDASTAPPVIVISAEKPDVNAGGNGFTYVPAAFAAELLPANVSCLIELARLRGEVARRDERIDALGRQVDLMGDAVAEEMRASAGLRERVGEQIHRSKNLLMTLQAVVRRTISEGRKIPEMRETLLGRLRALARAYDLVSAADGTGVEISEVVEVELADVLHRVTANGPPARLSGSAVQTFTLVLHELAANAVKHGALGSPDGSVAMGWTFFENGPDRFLEVVWTERGGQPPREPSGYGFGLTLVSSFANSRVPGSNVTFDESGLICRMRFPQNIISAS